MTVRWTVRAAEPTVAFSPQRKGKTVRFKSHPRNQRREHRPSDGVLFFEYGGNCTARGTGYEPDRRITRRVRRE